MPQAENTYSTRSKAILLLADTLFCLQQHVESASSKKAFCATSSFSLLLKANLFFCGRTKRFLLFFCAFCKNDLCSWQKRMFAILSFAKMSNRSKHSWKKRKCGQLICLSHKSFCGKNNKTLTLFAKKIMCDRT